MITIPKQRTITYANSSRFAFPSWLARRVYAANRRRGLASVRGPTNAFYRLAEFYGVNADHLGRKGDALTFEPYVTSLDVDAIKQLATELGCGFEVDAEQSEWNPDDENGHEGFFPTTFVRLSEPFDTKFGEAADLFTIKNYRRDLPFGRVG